jgi:N-methylhydantoinase B
VTSQNIISPVTFEVVRNRLVAVTEEMRIALQNVSGSPTVTEASDFFTGIFLPDGAVVSMGFQVALQAPVSGTVIRHINSKKSVVVRNGDMFVGNDPFIGALHQNDVQMIGPIFAGEQVIAWAGVQAHQTDVGGMDFASWCPKAKDVFQEGMRIPCVKLVDQGELREDVLEMITTASRLPAQLGLDIRAFIATINVARTRIGSLLDRYGTDCIVTVMRRMIASSEGKMRARLRELPDGDYRACDFLEHDGHNNSLYKVDVQLRKRGDGVVLDFSDSSRQAPGFINATRAGLAGGVAGAVLPTLAYDTQWNQGALAPFEIIAPDGLICTAQFPAPVGAATVETIWVIANTVSLALNKLLATSPKYRHRTQGVNDGTMATFNLGGINQFGEPFGLHLMDPLAGGSAAFASKDGVNAGGPITSPVSAIADVERNEQVSPLFYFYRKLAADTAGAGRYRGGVSGCVALTLGGIERADALIMTHGAEVPNSQGLGGGWPGSTVSQRFGRSMVRDGRVVDGEWQQLGPKPGLMPITNCDVFAVSWQGGGGFGDPIERDPPAVQRDVAAGLVSHKAAADVYGVILVGDTLDTEATSRRRTAIRYERIGRAPIDVLESGGGHRFGAISESLLLVEDDGGIHVTTVAGFVLCTDSTRWRAGAVSVTYTDSLPLHKITLHAGLALTAHYCPATGTLLAIDVHERGKTPADDVVLDLGDRKVRSLHSAAIS